MIQRTLRFSNLLTAAAVLCALAGCTKTPPPPFRLNMTNVVAKQIPAEQRQAVADVLGAMFGTPDEPFAMPETGLDIRRLRMAAGQVWSEDGNTKHGLYRRHCVHCHGISGDGHGPTAMILNPYPRDYRKGVFKFKSNPVDARPTDDDLRRVLHNGVPGTAMPAFALLPPDEVGALLEYVKYLSMRGQMEEKLEQYVFDEPDKPLNPASDAQQRTAVSEIFAEVIDGWKTAGEKVVVPEEKSIPANVRSADEIKASVAKGRELFYGTRANCFLCHGPTGLGDGQQSGFDEWTKPVTDFIKDTDALPEAIERNRKELAKMTGEDRQKALQRIDELSRERSERDKIVKHLLPVRNAIPRNLREGMLRGGNRPIDIFWRISTGIAGTPMPAAPATLTQEDVWHIVDYVQSLPFEPSSRPLASPVNTAEVTK